MSDHAFFPDKESFLPASAIPVTFGPKQQGNYVVVRSLFLMFDSVNHFDALILASIISGFIPDILNRDEFGLSQLGVLDNLASGVKFKLIVFVHIVVFNHPTHLRLNRLEALDYRLMGQNRSKSVLPIVNNQHASRQPTNMPYKQET